MNVEIRKLGTGELPRFQELIRVFEDVFEMKDFRMPEPPHLQQLLEKDSFFVFVALLENKVVGGLTAYQLDQYYSVRPLVYVYDLAVKREFQWQGIGKKLMAAIVDYGREIGAEEVFVQADEPDDYALKFYRSTGARGEKVVHFYYPLNKL